MKSNNKNSRGILITGHSKPGVELMSLQETWTTRVESVKLAKERQLFISLNNDISYMCYNKEIQHKRRLIICQVIPHNQTLIISANISEYLPDNEIDRKRKIMIIIFGLKCLLS